MEVRRGDIELRVAAQLARLVEHDLAVLVAEPGVDDQRRLAADHDPDVRDERVVLIEDHVDVLGDLCARLGLDQRVAAGRRLRVRREREQGGAEREQTARRGHGRARVHLVGPRVRGGGHLSAAASSRAARRALVRIRVSRQGCVPESRDYPLTDVHGKVVPRILS